MLYYDRIGVFERIDANKTSTSKKVLFVTIIIIFRLRAWIQPAVMGFMMY